MSYFGDDDHAYDGGSDGDNDDDNDTDDNDNNGDDDGDDDNNNDNEEEEEEIRFKPWPLVVPCKTTPYIHPSRLLLLWQNLSQNSFLGLYKNIRRVFSLICSDSAWQYHTLYWLFTYLESHKDG